MSYDYHELKHTRIGDLRKIAEGLDHEALQGYTQFHKEDLLKAICSALKIEMQEHHDVVGIDKAAIKKQIGELKALRDEAIRAKDRKEIKSVRRRIHHLKRTIRRATV